MTKTTYFIDTYAFMELFQGNNAVKKKFQHPIVTTKLNLMEMHYHTLRLKGEQTAKKRFQEFAPACTRVRNADIIRANHIKRAHKKRRLSYIDCVGYAISLRLGARFLTGDKQFKDLPGVAFIENS